VEEDAFEKISKNIAPKLRALQVHNSTVYRWNRPCYGISPNGKPHLRIENRVIPAGPTVLDEVANAAFWLGAMMGMADKVDDVTEHISWSDVRDNFGKAARFGIDSNFTWFKDKKIGVCELVSKELIPIARAGLKKMKVVQKDIDRYMNVIEGRAKAHMNGARWQLRAFTKLKEETSRDEALSVLTASIIENQNKGLPGHKWKMPELTDLKEYRPSKIKVEEFMQTDLFTVQKDDIVELVAEMMDWREISFTPVENTKGDLIGLVSSKMILRHLVRGNRLHEKGTGTVKDIMMKNPPTISSDATILEAMKKMREAKIGCLPVIKGKELIGLITQMDFLRISGRLIERLEP
jgi:CBS domain-containing protein